MALQTVNVKGVLWPSLDECRPLFNMQNIILSELVRGTTTVGAWHCVSVTPMGNLQGMSRLHSIHALVNGQPVTTVAYYLLQEHLVPGDSPWLSAAVYPDNCRNV